MPLEANERKAKSSFELKIEEVVGCLLYST